MTHNKERTFQGKATKPLDLGGFLARNLKKIAVRSALLLLLATPIMLVLMNTSYVAQGVLQISPTSPSLLNESNASAAEMRNYSTYVATQVARLKQHELLMAALNRLPPSVKERFVDADQSLLEAAVDLEENIVVQQIPRTHLIALSIKKKNPAGLAELINSVLSVYLEKLQEEEQGIDNRLLTYLRQEKRKTASNVSRLTNEIQRLALELGVTTFDEAENYIQSKHLNIQEQHLRAQAATLQATKSLEGLHAKAERLRAMPMDLLIKEELQRTPGYAEKKSYTYQAVQELTASIDALAENNPTKGKVHQRIGEVQEQFDDLEESMKKEVEALVRERIDFQLDQEVLEAEHHVAVVSAVQEELAMELVKSASELAEHSNKIVHGQRLTEELENQQNLHATLEDRIYQLSIEGKAPGRTTLEGIARAIRKSNLKKLAMFGVLGSLMLATGLTFLMETVRNRIVSKTDATNAVGSPPSWPIPFAREEGGEPSNFSRTTIERPSSTACKAIHSLAVKLDRERLQNGSKVALFTGIGRKSGTTRLALNCAHAMTETCDRVLLIDLNRQHPALHTLVDNSGAVGPAPLDAVVADEERGIDVLATGSHFHPGKLERQEILKLLDSARERYDFVILDSAPLTQSDLTEFLAGHCDVVAPIVCGERSQYADTHQSIQILLRLGVAAIAPVLNWRLPTAHDKRRDRLRLLPKSARNWCSRRAVRRAERKRSGDASGWFQRNGWEELAFWKGKEE